MKPEAPAKYKWSGLNQDAMAPRERWRKTGWSAAVLLAVMSSRLSISSKQQYPGASWEFFFWLVQSWNFWIVTHWQLGSPKLKLPTRRLQLRPIFFYAHQRPRGSYHIDNTTAIPQMPRKLNPRLGFRGWSIERWKNRNQIKLNTTRSYSSNSFLTYGLYQNTPSLPGDLAKVI